MNILVVGGAGYIGSHMALMLSEKNYQVTVLDNLSSGHEDAVLSGKFIKADLSDTKKLDDVFYANKFDAVMHFASSIQVGESVKDPGLYYQNNVANTINLLNTMVKHKVLKLVFSSTAAIFGEPKHIPIDNAHPINPINPYGKSKAMVESMLTDFDKAYGLKSICLRYFNAAGADAKARLGERHDPETHLIPLVLQAASGRRADIKVFGQDYDTKDGSCVRDYVHVVDLCSAHALALKKLFEDKQSAKFNLGNGKGFSVKEVIAAAKKVTGKSIKVILADRRSGDPATLVADANHAKHVLNWQPKYANLETIIKHAWQWEQKGI